MRLWRAMSLCVVLSACGAAVAAAPVPQDPYAHLEQVMQDPLFQRWQRRIERPEASSDWSRRLEMYTENVRAQTEAFFEWLFASLWGGGGTGRPGGGWGGAGALLKWIGWALAALVVLLIVLVVVKLVREARAAPSRATLTREQLRAALDAGEALAADSDAWVEEAQRLADEQDLRRAYRAMYLALLAGLHRARRIDFRRSRTNWVYVDHYRGADDERQSFADLTRRFDDVWYGQRPPARESFGGVREQVDALLGKGAAHA